MTTVDPGGPTAPSSSGCPAAGLTGKRGGLSGLVPRDSSAVTSEAVKARTRTEATRPIFLG